MFYLRETFWKCSPYSLGGASTRPMTICQNLEVKGQHFAIYILSRPYCCVFMILLKCVDYNNNNKLCRCVAYKIHDSMSKIKATLSGQRSKLCSVYLVWTIALQVIVISLWQFAKMFIIICSCVACKTHDSMAKVKVTIRGQRGFIPCHRYNFTSYSYLFMILGK